MIAYEADNLFSSLADETTASNLYRFEAAEDLSEITSECEAWETQVKAPIATAVPGAHTDDPVELYFREVRRHDLLSVAAERALWRCIERHKARMRRALCLSPIALLTLTRLSNQIKHGEIPLQEVVSLSAEDDEATPACTLEHLSDTIAHLHELAADLSPDRPRAETRFISATERSQQRRERARVWRQWVSIWEALPLHPSTYETMRLDLEHAMVAQPENARLRTAQHAWMAAKRQLDEATAHMLQANLRLVVHMALRFRNNRVPLLDLIQEGNVGLMRAIEKFEPHRGHKFITYAHWWVRQAIGRALMNQGRTVRLPGHIIERRQKVRAATDQLWRLSGQAPTAQEIGDALGWTPQEVEQLHIATQETVPLERRLADGDRTVADLIEDTAARTPNAAAEEEQLKQCLEVCFASLKPREVTILRRRFGLETGKPQSLQEIGDGLGLSRERVRQIEKATLKRLRESPFMTQLSDFVTE